MDAGQIFATGGATGTVGVVLFLLYKFLTTKHRIRSNCFGKVVEIETEVSPPDKNITIRVDESHTHTRSTDEYWHVNPGNSIVKNEGTVSGGSERKESGSHQETTCGEGTDTTGKDSGNEPLP